MHGDGNAFFESLGEVVALQNARHGVLGTQTNQIFKSKGLQPFAVESNLCLVRIEDLEDLRFVGLRITRDSSRVIGGREAFRPVGSPIRPVMSPIRKMTVWPRSWKCFILRRAPYGPDEDPERSDQSPL